ncbi:hypothetical protein SDC9_122171 [bioreactor metagenome]|uniref:Uncharacterized protein n=1 Tax=bioreactor metagenome TaxID=1076179 RepID=A0A645CE51_9ZZZZ
MAAADSLFLFLNFHAVKVGDLPFHRLDGLVLVDGLHVEIDDDARFRIEKIRKHGIRQLRR